MLTADIGCLAQQRRGIGAAQVRQDGLAGQHACRPQRIAQLTEDRLTGVQGLFGAVQFTVISQQDAEFTERPCLGGPVADGTERGQCGVQMRSAGCPLLPEPAQSSDAHAAAGCPAAVADRLEGLQGARQVIGGIVQTSREAVSVAAVTQNDGNTSPVLQFGEDGQALGERRDRGAGVAVVAVHDGELPHGPGLPPAVTELPGHLEPFG